MSKIDVLKEILKWSTDRPIWQRDALRRLLINSALIESDIEELTGLCKQAHGLSESNEFFPLSEQHLPKERKNNNRIILESIFHHKGVNALAESQTLNFGKNLTVVYGDNASGKSGYTRILKEACRARGTEEILGNVLSGVTPIKPIVSIRYLAGNETESQEWVGNEEDDAISGVSVFDAHAAAVYLNEKTDVAFRPFGLDLFDKLVKACRAVRQILEREEKAQKISLIQNMDFPEGTVVAKLVASISSLTVPEKVKLLASLSEDERKRIAFLEKRLADLQAKNSAKLMQELGLREKRFRTLLNHLKAVDETLSDAQVKNVFGLLKNTQVKAKTVAELQEKTFPKGLLLGTGSDKWRELWAVAKEFSTEVAYPEQVFPVTEEDARCLLCQQDIEQEAATRLKQFEEFIQSVAENEFQQARSQYREIFKLIENLIIVTEVVKETINEIRIEDEVLADEINTSLSEADTRHKAIIQILRKKNSPAEDLTSYVSTKVKVETIIEQLVKRSEELKKSVSPDAADKIKVELAEFNARKKLSINIDAVLAEIERKKKIAAYGLCIKDTNTQGITTKSGALTKEVVTKQLQNSFSSELQKLRFCHIEVEMQEAGGEQGNFYHKVVLKRAPGINVPKVVSEGEARCLSIAAFFAELSTADEESAILFDDPVSSLDYKWRSHVAARLVEEAKHRQVIVFTHDIVFLLSLRQLAQKEKVDKLDQHLRQLPHIGAGICREELPWVAMPVKKRIGFIKNEFRTAEKLYREGHRDAYEKEAGLLYGLLREAWERALEEVLLGGVVERYRKNIQTLQISVISDITPEDCTELDKGMTKCSEWLTGHDQAPAARDEMPLPNELEADISLLEKWVNRIKIRRK